MPLIYWHPSDEPANLIGNLKVSDDSDGWWSGIQFNFVSVAIALTIAAGANAQAASRVATQPQDELVFQQVFDDTFWNTPPPVLPAAVLPQPWTFETGDIVPQPVVFQASDEAFWADTISPVIPQFNVPQQWIFETTDIVPQPAAATLDDGFWIFTGIVITPPILPPPWSFDQGEVIGVTTVFIPWIAEDDA
jgi:hypothetical protein